MKKYDYICDTLIFNRCTTVCSSLKNFSLWAISLHSLYDVCISLFLIHTPGSNTLSVLSSFPFLKERLLWGCAPRSVGTQRYRVHGPPWELNTIRTPEAGPYVLGKQDWFVAIKFCCNLSENQFKVPFIVLWEHVFYCQKPLPSLPSL